MIRRDGAETRKERIEKIARSIQAALYVSKDAGYIPLEKTVAKLSIETGLTARKIIEYLGLLESANQFILDNEKDQIKRFEVDSARAHPREKEENL